MGSMNMVVLVGHLGQNPELKETNSGRSVCTLRIATNERWKDKEGQAQERTEWHNVVVWGHDADHCGQYLHQGSAVCIRGRIQTRKWEDRDGNERSSTEIVADMGGVEFLGSKAEEGGYKNGASKSPRDDGAEEDGRDVPF
jgi:single-strand DNA-binding protein